MSKRPWGKREGPPKFSADILHRDLRQCIVVSNAVLDAVVQGILRRIWHKGNSDAVEAQARLIHDAGREEVHLVQGADLPVRRAVIAKAWNGVALQVGLGARILLPGVIEVKIVFCREGVEQVARELVGLHWSGRRTLEDSTGCVIAGWDQVDQLGVRRAGRAGGKRRTLCRAQDIAVEEQSLMLPQTLIAQKEESVVFPDGAGERAARIVPDEWSSAGPACG